MALSSVAAAPLRVALVHDFLLDLRGAERTFRVMCDIWPDADVFSAVYDERGTEGQFAHRNVQTSFLQRVRPTARTFRALLPFYPAAIESLDLSAYDLVVSSSSAWAHAVICDVDTVHVSYCHNPFRYAWNDRDRTLAEHSNPVARAVLRQLFRRWRQWDWVAAQRVDRYVANSHATQRRIAAYFGRESSVVYPPVETARFTPGEVGDYYLVLSELIGHKRIETAVRAFNRLRLPLVVAGDGPEARRLRRIAGATVRFVGRISDAEASRLVSGARALIVTAVEEFGIAAVEAQAAGRPVLAPFAGGTRETVIDGVTGRFWGGDVDGLADAVASFDVSSIDPRACVQNAARFDAERFREALPREVEAALGDSGGTGEAHRRAPRRSIRSRRLGSAGRSG